MNAKNFLCLSMSLLLAGTAGFAQAPKPGASVPATKIIPMAAAPKAASAPVKLLEAGAVAPDFLSIDPSGKSVRLSNWKAKVIVLDFWATWCGPCLASLPHTQAVAKQYKDQGVVVMANCTSDTRAKFDEWLKANQSKYPDIAFTSDPNERGSATFEQRAARKLYGVSGIPTQFIMGRDGKVVAALVGYSKGDVRLEAALAKAGIKVDPAVAATGEEQMRRN